MDKFVDISYHKGIVDLNRIKNAGYDAVVLKATDGFFMPDSLDENPTWTGHTDPTFYLYWKQLKNLFRWRGAYHFLRVDDEIAKNRGRLTSYEQIPYFYEVITSEGLEWDDIIILDIEQAAGQIDYLSGSVIATRIQDAIASTETLFERKPIIYTGAWWWEIYHKYFDSNFMYEYPFWLSHYWGIDSNNDINYNGYNYYLKPNRAFPEAWKAVLEDRLAYCRIPMINNDPNGTPSINPDKIWMWQFTESGRVDGVSSTLPKNVDINYYMYNSKEADWDEARGEKPITNPPIEPPEVPSCKEILEKIIKILKDLIDMIQGELGG